MNTTRLNSPLSPDVNKPALRSHSTDPHYLQKLLERVLNFIGAAQVFTAAVARSRLTLHSLHGLYTISRHQACQPQLHVPDST